MNLLSCSWMPPLVWRKKRYNIPETGLVYTWIIESREMHELFIAKSNYLLKGYKTTIQLSNLILMSNFNRLLCRANLCSIVSGRQWWWPCQPLSCMVYTWCASFRVWTLLWQTCQLVRFFFFFFFFSSRPLESESSTLHTLFMKTWSEFLNNVQK